jgi:uncharacterized protein (TIGR00255 family)
MLVSMTGFGSASGDSNGVSCSVEIRSVNNRFFKAVIKLPDKLAALEPEIEKLLRDTIVRGSLVLAVSVKDTLSTTSVAINRPVLEMYLRQIQEIQGKLPGLGASPRIELTNLLMLPGVVDAGEDSAEYLATHRDLVLKLIADAVARLTDMRKREGAALWVDLKKHLEVVRTSLGKIAELAPSVAKGYHEKLRARVTQLVSDAKLSFSDHDLLKEVALFADRVDISEEIARLSGHVEQFSDVCTKSAAEAAAGGGAGRKLDFIAQEMLREANTIASKANDAGIAKLTVEIKSSIDRVKEQVQNVE